MNRYVSPPDPQNDPDPIEEPPTIAITVPAADLIAQLAYVADAQANYERAFDLAPDESLTEQRRLGRHAAERYRDATRIALAELILLYVKP